MVLSLLLAVAGMAALAAAQQSERRRRGQPPLSARGLWLRRGLGAGCLAGSAAAAVAASGIDMGLVYWVAVTALSGLALASLRGVVAERTGARRRPARRRRAG